MPGRSSELKGAVKEKVGRALGDIRLEAEGKADRAVGKASRETAGAGHRLAGTVKRAGGGLTGNERLEAKGRLQNLKGKAQSIS